MYKRQVSATLFEKEVLRCNLCGRTFTAPTPPEAGERKYASGVGVLVSLLRYGSGMPHYRLEKLQASLGVPLPAATQWELVAEVARMVQPVGDHLKWLAAQASGVHNDDTTMRVGQLRQQIQRETDPERTGIFTSGILANLPGHPIALFFTGRQHAGENLEDVLSQRSGHLPPPLQMADGLSRNRPKTARTIEGCCLSHGRRGFVQVADDFPEEVRRVLESVREIYRFEAITKKQGLDPEARLRFHQTHSQPVMESLKEWLDEQIEGNRVEPNGNLGGAIEFMRRRWGPLTLFLREPGAPLDNNICEQSLKMAILHRKNSLGFKTQHGAQVGDLFMSLIQTCRLNRVNPWDYLMALVHHPDHVRASPDQWMPWNYRATLERLAQRGSSAPARVSAAAVTATGDLMWDEVDAVVYFWVRRSRMETGMDARLLDALRGWFAGEWRLPRTVYVTNEQFTQQLELIRRTDLRLQFEIREPGKAGTYLAFG